MVLSRPEQPLAERSEVMGAKLEEASPWLGLGLGLGLG